MMRLSRWPTLHILTTHAQADRPFGEHSELLINGPTTRAMTGVCTAFLLSVVTEPSVQSRTTPCKTTTPQENSLLSPVTDDYRSFNRVCLFV
jgi:hypothetical protein